MAVGPAVAGHRARPRRGRRTGSSTWSTGPGRPGRITRSRPRGRGLDPGRASALWLLSRRRGALSRLAGLASAGWGLVVWVFGESFGGILAPGLSWLNGAPGAAAALLRRGRADRAARPVLAQPAAGPAPRRRLGRVPGRDGACCRPGRAAGSGGHARTGRPGSLAAMVQRHGRHARSPRALAGWVSGFGSFDRGPRLRGEPGRVIALALAGAALTGLRARPAGPRLAGLRAGPVRRRLVCSAWPTGCWSRTSASSAASAPTRTA